MLPFINKLYCMTKKFCPIFYELGKFYFIHTICPRSSDPFYLIAIHYMKLVITSWTDGSLQTSDQEKTISILTIHFLSWVYNFYHPPSTSEINISPKRTVMRYFSLNLNFFMFAPNYLYDIPLWVLKNWS